jgi:hypothetical protein
MLALQSSSVLLLGYYKSLDFGSLQILTEERGKVNYSSRLPMITVDLSEGQLKILNIVAEKTGRSLSKSVFDTAVIDDSGLPADEVYTYLSQLQGLGLITIGMKVSGADFRTINITKEGLDATSENQPFR